MFRPAMVRPNSTVFIPTRLKMAASPSSNILIFFWPAFSFIDS